MAGGRLLQNAVTATGNGNEIDCRGMEGEYTLSIVAAGTITAGGVTWEEAPFAGYTGTWDAIAAELTPVTNAVVVARVTGAFGGMRARVSTTVTGGGTVTVRVQPPLVRT